MYKGVPRQLLGHLVFSLVRCSGNSWCEGWDRSICVCIVGMRTFMFQLVLNLICICIILPVQLYLICIPKSSNETLERGSWSCGAVHSHQNSWAGWWLRVCCVHLQPPPVIPSSGMEFWDPGAIPAFPLAEQVLSAPGAIPNQIPPLAWSLCGRRWGTETKTWCFWEVGFLICLDTYKTDLNSV